MPNSFPKKQWYLYDTTDGRIVLKHPYHKNMDIPCPYCGTLLNVIKYKSICCGKLFTTGFWEIKQKEPLGYHKRKSGRGWKSLRPYNSSGDLFE